MKATYVVIISAVAGALLGAGISWANFSNSPPLFASKPADVLSAASGLHPKVLVDERAHDFGPVDRDKKVRHAYRFTNVGDGVLTLKAGATTCVKCTIAELSKSQVAPGETVDVVVEYTPNAQQPRFKQIAPILTNDPEQPRVELLVRGTVTAKFSVVPEYLVLSQVSANETKSAELKIWAFLSDEVQVVGHEFAGEDSAPFFEVHSETIPHDLLTEPGAKSGCRVVLTLKPGLPLGPIRQTIRLELRLQGVAETSTVEVPIEGTVDSDISIVGPGWDQKYGRLAINAVQSAKGATRKLFLLVRGDHRHDLAIKPGKLDPAWLKVELGEPTELNNGAVTQIPLTIEIPPGAPPANYLGTDQGKYAEIILETTHPQVKEIRLHLKFAIVH
jgi:hypothetical protein